MKIRIEKYQEEDKEKWDEFVMKRSVNGTIFQTRKFLSYHPAERFEDHSILIFDNDKLVCLVPVCKKGEGFFSHSGSSYGGPVIEPKYYKAKYLDILINEILNFYQNKIGFRIAPTIFSSKRNDMLIYFLGRKLAVKRELSVFKKVDSEDLLASFSRPRQRTAVRKLLRNGFEVKETNEEKEYKIFYKILVENLKKHKTTPTHTLDEFIRLKNILKENQLLLLGLDKNKIVGGVWIIKANNRAWHTFYIAKDVEANYATMPTIFLKAMEITRDSGVTYLNFGICTENEGEILNQGLISFKESLGAEPICRYIFKPWEK